MPNKQSKNKKVSKCCLADMIVRGKQQRGCTNWYECVKCAMPCDVNPITKVRNK